ncbi:hypothetical protein PILCRDRAFT_93376 [Piloderma croceum F 1598]|uniref:Uncharacterized protein n=1 Tax=Piloderma croceum (strain F 1598) TaxID=765440 RepID=A0A0C3EY65_PILCF|nr:hypothetical protein PILCRDRAFT_93376 [Piloderma croceum F 1598]
MSGDLSGRQLTESDYSRTFPDSPEHRQLGWAGDACYYITEDGKLATQVPQELESEDRSRGVGGGWPGKVIGKVLMAIQYQIVVKLVCGLMFSWYIVMGCNQSECLNSIWGSTWTLDTTLRITLDEMSSLSTDATISTAEVQYSCRSNSAKPGLGPNRCFGWFYKRLGSVWAAQFDVGRTARRDTNSQSNDIVPFYL